MWAIVDKVFALADELPATDRRDNDARAARGSRMEAPARAGDDQALRYLALSRHLRSHPTRRKSPSIVETGLNPSRVLASLAERGLVARDGVKGGGGACLTPEGRAVVAMLRVGPSCDETKQRD